MLPGGSDPHERQKFQAFLGWDAKVGQTAGDNTIPVHKKIYDPPSRFTILKR
jgi:hypothetical protein